MSKTASLPKTLFAVLLVHLGSLILGEHKFVPLEVLEVPADVKDLACPRTTPLKFFATREEADAAVRALRAEFEKRQQPQLE